MRKPKQPFTVVSQGPVTIIEEDFLPTKPTPSVAQLEAMTMPRPIEEAPKDERVLVFCPEESDYGYTAAWVVGEYVLDSWEGDSRLEDGVQPTHWLPLPPDPTEVTKVTEVTQ